MFGSGDGAVKAPERFRDEAQDALAERYFETLGKEDLAAFAMRAARGMAASRAFMKFRALLDMFHMDYEDVVMGAVVYFVDSFDVSRMTRRTPRALAVSLMCTMEQMFKCAMNDQKTPSRAGYAMAKSLDDPFLGDADSGDTWKDKTADRSAISDVIGSVERGLRDFTPFYRALDRMGVKAKKSVLLVMNGHTLDSAGRLVGVSRERVRQYLMMLESAFTVEDLERMGIGCGRRTRELVRLARKIDRHMKGGYYASCVTYSGGRGPDFVRELREDAYALKAIRAEIRRERAEAEERVERMKRDAKERERAERRRMREQKEFERSVAAKFDSALKDWVESNRNRKADEESSSSRFTDYVRQRLAEESNRKAQAQYDYYFGDDEILAM